MAADSLCAYCGKPGQLQRDHVVPRSRGGLFADRDSMLTALNRHGRRFD